VFVQANSVKRAGVVLFGLALLVPAVARANGQAFFAASFTTKPDLAYVGSVKDTAGRPLKGAQIVVWSVDYGLTFPTSTDDTGRYRSADVGASLKEVASAIDLKQLRMEVALPGYELVKPATIPDKPSGIVEIDFRMRKTGSTETPADESSHSRRSWTWLVPIGLIIIVIGAAARR
jgi:hypothetical protein